MAPANQREEEGVDQKEHPKESMGVRRAVKVNGVPRVWGQEPT